jgi:hypothetical protein
MFKFYIQEILIFACKDCCVYIKIYLSVKNVDLARLVIFQQIFF